MTTDDLRTREEALHRLARAASLVDSTHHFGALADAFTAGYLAHAAQQPSREQIARAAADDLYGTALVFLAKRPDESYRAHAERIGEWAADVLVALLDGARR